VWRRAASMASSSRRSELVLLRCWPRIRSGGLPVVMLTARGEPVDKLRGFEMGADDYLAKPFVTADLLARERCSAAASKELRRRPRL